jgi:hypothetical protein
MWYQPIIKELIGVLQIEYTFMGVRILFWWYEGRLRMEIASGDP